MVTNNKYLLRFLVLFVGLITIPFPFNVIPKLEFIEKAIFGVYQKIVPWVGQRILNLEKPITIFQNGSGDKTYDYVLLFVLFIVAILGTIIWSILDKKKRTYEKLNYWFLVLSRYYLGYFMIYYGLFKIMPIQFGEIAFWRLLQPYGESSPMGLAWTFLAYSKGYNLFMGLAEFFGGILLFHKKTRLLGGLILIPVTANIVAINFFYDVPVKLFSSQLLLIAIIVIAPDLKGLLNLIILNKPTNKIDSINPFESKKLKVGAIILKWIFVALILYNTIDYPTNLYKTRQQKPDLYGLYQVTNFVANQDTIPPILSHETRWRYIFIDRPNTIQFSRMNKSRYGLDSKIDTISKKITLTEFNDSTLVYTLDFKETDSTLILSGVFRKDTIFCETKRLDKKDFRLTSRGFNWINEYPYNR
ncbi:hypothetical protein MAR621_00124 [Maribacter dokdonensis]|uniref:hypothetical protein n=1 Tax=Maribacter dokdonensis TaxID=320912 RepID=UPI001B155CAA|nr:hypothetical protein [Maribacter dokdonensis]CAG2535296.1 hypothetical protein MAR621_00124 [Maribacter dokdonensis]